MSAPEMPRDPKVTKAFADLERERIAPAGDWQARVWSKIAREPELRRNRRWLRVFQATSAGLAVAVCLFGLYAYRTSLEADQKEAKSKANLEAYQAEVKKAQQEIDDAIDAERAATAALLGSKNIEDKARLEAALKRRQYELRDKRYTLRELRKREAKKALRRRERNKRVNVKCDPSDPLCGI